MSAAKLLPCPFCGCAAIQDKDSVHCSRLPCFAVGPNNDPKAEKWNAALRPAVSRRAEARKP